MSRCESCGRRLRQDEGKVCRICQGRILKQMQKAQKDREEIPDETQ